MLISDVMTKKVETVTSTTALQDIWSLMDARRIRRVPVVDNRKLIGIVSRNALERDIGSLMGTLTAREVMVTRMVTISPDATVEAGVALAQTKQVGALLVVQRGRLVGIATTNDFFYKLLNPVLGINLPGTRISIHRYGHAVDVEKILHTINKLGIDVPSMFALTRPDSGEHIFTAHLNIGDPSTVVAALNSQGYQVEVRERKIDT